MSPISVTGERIKKRAGNEPDHCNGKVKDTSIWKIGNALKSLDEIRVFRAWKRELYMKYDDRVFTLSLKNYLYEVFSLLLQIYLKMELG